MKSTSILFSLAFFAMLCFSGAWASDTAAPPETSVVKGKVLESKDVGSYTYLRLQTKDGETWAAVGKAVVSAGTQVTITQAMVMNNFESKALHKTFDSIIFGVLASGGVAASPAIAETGAEDIKVAKASGSGAHTVAEIVTQSANLKGKTVVVRGKVVKYNPSVMGKNWIHLRDGSGSAADNSNDVLVTTSDKTKLGDVVVAKGVVHTDKDFGSGYSYKVLVEEATLQK